MKRMLLFSLLAFAVVLLTAGCSSSRYAVVTTDYAVHISQSKPELDPATNTFTIRDENGAEISIPRDDLKQIRELR